MATGAFVRVERDGKIAYFFDRNDDSREWFLRKKEESPNASEK